MNLTNKRELRLLRAIAQRAARELELVRENPDTPSPLDYFYGVMESVFIKNNPESILNSSPDNQPVLGIYCIMIPEEFIYAAGAVPIRLCSGCFESSQIGEDLIPRDGCPLVKSTMGFSIQTGLKIFDMCDVVVIPTTCDAKRKLGEELSAFKEVWMLEVPHIKDTDFSRTMWIEQMFALKTKIENYVSTKGKKKRITRQKLYNAIKNSARAQFEIRRLILLRKSASPVISGRQAAIVLNSYAYAPVTDWTDALSKLNTQLSENSNKNKLLYSETRPRIYIVGSPMIFPNLKIIALVEEMGGIVVCDESCTGDRSLYDPIGSTEKSLNNQVIAIASRYLAPCVCPSFSPNGDRLEKIKQTVSEFDVDGVLYHVLKGCVIYDFEVPRVEKVLTSGETPLLRIETDYNQEDIEQIRTRIEAFIEILKSKKKRAVLEHI